jgi:benzoate membrane transport protein
MNLSLFVAGFVTVLVGFSSSAVIVLQAAQSLGATTAQVNSWMLALGLGMGLTCIGLSLRYKMPLTTAWSTPGAAMLISSAASQPLGLPEATGAFIFSAGLMVLVGVTGLFERTIQKLPQSLAAAMLAGVLLRFGMDVFVAFKAAPWLVGLMFAVYVLMKRWQPRYAVPLALLTGLLVAQSQGAIAWQQIEWQLAAPVWVTPVWDWPVLIGVGIPLFIVTMASQNVPGYAVLKSNGYQPPISPVVTSLGLATAVLAPFGGFALNLAAITSAICASNESHADPSKRYLATLSAGVLYCLLGLLGAAVVGLFAAFPKPMILAIAGLALLSTIANGLASALQETSEREAAILTFLVTASGLSFGGIGSAFWGLLIGVVALVVMRVKAG